MAVPAPGEPEGDATPLDDARENLAIVKVAVPREVAALSKRRQELAQLISDLAERQEPSLADQLAAIRDRRSTQISGRS
jgi:hypothetical protein